MMLYRVSVAVLLYCSSIAFAEDGKTEVVTLGVLDGVSSGWLIVYLIALVLFVLRYRGILNAVAKVLTYLFWILFISLPFIGLEYYAATGFVVGLAASAGLFSLVYFGIKEHDKTIPAGLENSLFIHYPHWRKVIEDCDAEIILTGLFRSERVKFRFGPWTVMLRESYIRLRGVRQMWWYLETEAENPAGFWCKTKPAWPATRFFARFRRNIVNTGDRELDRTFMLRGSNADDVKRILTHDGLRELLLEHGAQTYIEITPAGKRAAKTISAVMIKDMHWYAKPVVMVKIMELLLGALSEMGFTPVEK